MNIKTKITILFILLIIIVVGLVSVMEIRFLTESQKNNKSYIYKELNEETNIYCIFNSKGKISSNGFISDYPLDTLLGFVHNKTLDGIKHNDKLYKLSYYNINDGTKIIVAYPIPEASIPQSDIKRIILEVSLLEIIAFLVIGSFLSEKIFTPMQTLKDTIDKISEGQLQEIPLEIAEDSYEELGSVAKSFNQIVSQLSEARTTLNMLKTSEQTEQKEELDKIEQKPNTSENKEIVIPNIIGNSTEIIKAQELIKSISDTESSVLIYGESGTGKSLIAEYICKTSPRARQNFVSINCSTISENMFESEMFGHKKGSFDEAITDKKGAFKEAEDGTLFLKEIDSLSLSNQAKLLKVLEEGNYRSVGEDGEPIKSNIRLICSTNKNLIEEVKNGNFMEGLFYKINVVEIKLLPLRERHTDINLLADHFIKIFSKKYNRNILNVSEDFYKLLANYSWPGNIRQMENVIERAVIMQKSDILEEADISFPKTESNTKEDLPDFTIPDDGLPLTETMDKVEKRIIAQALQNSKWNYSKAASSLGVTRQNLNYKLKKYNLHK